MASAPESSWKTILTSRFPVGDKIPTSGSELSTRLTEALRKILGGTVPQDAIETTIQTPPNIELLRANLSHISMDVDEGVAQRAKSAVKTESLQGADVLPATIHKVMVKAHPLTVQGVPVDFDMQVEDVPFNWVTDTSGQVALALTEDGTDKVHGSFAANATKEALQEAVRQLVAAGAHEKGFTLQDLDFDVQQSGNNFQIRGQARLRKSILSAHADARASLKYDPANLTLRVNDVEVTSGNPAVSVLLHMVQGQIDQLRGRTFDLNEQLSPTGKKLKSLDITVRGTDIRVCGDF